MNKAIKVSIKSGSKVLKSALFLSMQNALAFADTYVHPLNPGLPKVADMTYTTAMFGVTVEQEVMPDDPWGDEEWQENVYPFTTQEKAEEWAKRKAQSYEGDGTKWVTDPNHAGGTMLIQGNVVTRIHIGLVEVDQSDL